MTDLVRSFEICRIDEDQRMVYGIVSTECEASDGLVVSAKAIEDAWPEYMKFGNIREMHQDIAAGVVEDSELTDNGRMVRIYVAEDSTWNKVKRGVLKALSIRGPILEQIGNVVTRLKLIEISLVDRGADPGALITMFRAEGSEQTQAGQQPQGESTMTDKARLALAAAKPGASVKREDGADFAMTAGSDPAIEAAEVNILAEIGTHVDAIGSLVAKFNDLHDSEKVAPEVLAHMQNSHRSMGKAMSAHLKASTSYGAKDEGEAGAEEAQRAEGIPHKPAGSKLDQVLSRVENLAAKVEAIGSVKRSEGTEGYKPVVVPETPLIAVAKEESVVRAEGSGPVDNDPKEGTPEWEALTEFKRFEIVDRRNTQKHIARKA